MNGFFQTYKDILYTIDDAIKQERRIPALMLLYSAIDSFSLLAEPNNQTGRKVFKDWVKRWMLDKYPLPCNEADIYSARCGLLHQHISESDLTKDKKAKEIYYVWGQANLEILKAAIKNSDKSGRAVAVKGEDLIWSFRRGMADCMNEIENDANWNRTFEEKAKKMFVSIDNEGQ